MHSECERARQWTSMEVDGELSAFERVLLNAHLADCADCRGFRSGVSEFTHALRTAPPEPFAGVHLRRPRSRFGRAFAPAVAALAFLAVGLGSLVASSHVGPGLDNRAAPSQTVVPLIAGIDGAVNQSTLRSLRQLDIAAAAARSGRAGGGPYVQER